MNKWIKYLLLWGMGGLLVWLCLTPPLWIIPDYQLKTGHSIHSLFIPDSEAGRRGRGRGTNRGTRRGEDWGAGGGVPVAGGDVCGAGALGLSSHFEGTDDADKHDVTTGSPAGCSLGDTVSVFVGTATFSEVQAYDGVASVLLPDDSNDYIQWTITNRDIFDEDDYTVEFYLYIITWTEYDSVLKIWGDSNDHLIVQLYATDEFRIYHNGNSAGTYWSTSGLDIPTGQWTKITISGQTGVAGTDQWATCDAKSISRDGDIISFDAAPATVNFGGYGNSPNVYGYVDAIKIYKAKQ